MRVLHNLRGADRPSPANCKIWGMPHAFRTLLRELWLDLLALVWPTECVACGAPDRDCCAACLEVLRGGDPVLHRDASVPVLARAAYAGPLRAMLVALKHGGYTVFARELGAQLAHPLGQALAAAEAAEAAGGQPGAGRDPPLIVTVPSRAASERLRGYRHVEMITRSALRIMSPAPARMVRALRPLRGRTGQVGLSAEARQRNARLVAVRRLKAPLLRGREVVLVDDIITTGATVSGAAEALEAAGARVIAVVALCLVERRDTRA